MGGKISKKLGKSKSKNRGPTPDSGPSARNGYSRQVNVKHSSNFGHETHNRYDEGSIGPPPPYWQFDILNHSRDSGHYDIGSSNADVSGRRSIPNLMDIAVHSMNPSPRDFTSSNPNLGWNFGNVQNSAVNPSGMSKKPIFRSVPEFNQLRTKVQSSEASGRDKFWHAHNNAPRGPARNCIMSQQQLQALSRKNIREVLFELQNYSSGFIPLMKEAGYSDQVLVLVMDILTKVCVNDDCPSTANALLQTILFTKLFNCRMVTYLQNTPFNCSIEDLTVLRNLLIVLAFLLREFKREAESKLGQCLQLGRQVISQVIGTSGDHDDVLLQELRILNEVQKLCKEPFLVPTVTSMDTFPGVFRIAYQPRAELKVQSDYDYKVQQFNIVLDDFNDTLTLLLEGSNTYHNVRVIGTECSFAHGLLYKLDFEARDHHDAYCNLTTKLLEGSTVFFGTGFQGDLHCATVVRRIPEGCIWVKLLDRKSTILRSERSLVMAENLTYEDDFISVMKALQLLKKCPLPFSNLIFGMKKKLTHPKYLKQNSSISFPFPAKTNIKKQYFALHPNNWPVADSFNFDGPFYQAVKHAITNELALIQCRPMTDCIDFGHKVLQVLLHNATNWLISSSPILVLFHTDDALDEFLKKVLAGPSVGKVVRIGGQSKNVELHQYEISQLRIRTLAPSYVANNRRTLQNKLKNLKLEITSMKDLLEKAELELLGINALKSLMSAGHFGQLMQLESATEAPLMSWLLGSFCSPHEMQSLLNGYSNVVGPQETGAARNIKFPKRQKCYDFPWLVRLEMARRVFTPETDNFEEFDQMSESSDRFISKTRLMMDPIGVIKGKKAYVSDMIACELKKNDVMEKSEVHNVHDVLKLKLQDRWKLYRFWKASFINLAKDYLRIKEDKFEKLFEQLQEVVREVDVSILQTSKVVGMSMAAAAKHHRLLKIVGPKIVIVQEAGKIPECKLVACLTEQCQHLILIGDHHQLKPTNNGFRFAETNNYLPTNSLFEKLIGKGLHHVIN